MLKNNHFIGLILYYLSVLGWEWEGHWGVYLSPLVTESLCQNFVQNGQKFPSTEMIFKLWFVITKSQLFMHYGYFEWAPCIETFGFFSKCVLRAKNWFHIKSEWQQKNSVFTLFMIKIEKWNEVVWYLSFSQIGSVFNIL